MTQHLDAGAESKPYSPLNTVGRWLIGLALGGLVYFGLLFPTAVTQESTAQMRALGLLDAARIENIGLLSRRETGVTVSSALLIAGVVLFVAGRIEDRLDRVTPQAVIEP